VLYPAWELAVRPRPARSSERVGWGELDKPGRRIEAIAAPSGTPPPTRPTPPPKELRRSCTVSSGRASSWPPRERRAPRVQLRVRRQLGLALIDDPTRTARAPGRAYLRIAGRGLRARAPGIFRKLADAANKADDAEAARGYLDQVKASGLEVKPERLAKTKRDIYLAALKNLADLDDARGDFRRHRQPRLYLEAGAATSFEISAAAPSCTPRPPTDERPDPGRDRPDVQLHRRDLLKKKDSYYFSVTEDKLRSVRDRVSGFFDVGVLRQKAMGILNAKTDA